MSIVKKRKKTRSVTMGDVKVGDFADISVQSMTNTKTADVEKTVGQIQSLEHAGCDIVRVAVPDMDSAKAVSKIKERIKIPLIADIHFDHRLAIEAAKNGADGLRINPGNIGKKENIKKVANCAKDYNIPIRIGVNAGSLEQDLLDSHGGVTPSAMVESAMRNVELLDLFGFNDIKISIKASDVSRSVEAYRSLSERCDFPLHVGITEAGSLYPGLVKSSLGIGMLLSEGIGDTIRVSLTRDPVEEIRAGYEILRALDLRRYGPEIISCPTCGRCNIDLFEIVEKVEKELSGRKTPIKIAIMGCVVNGPGEAKEADLGVAGGMETGILFKKGKVVKKFPQEKLVEELMKEVEKFENEK